MFISGETFENETAVVAGWGQVEYAGPTSKVILQVPIPVWNQELCADSFLQRITENNLCAAGYQGGQDSCQVCAILNSSYKHFDVIS